MFNAIEKLRFYISLVSDRRMFNVIRDAMWRSAPRLRIPETLDADTIKNR